MIINSSTRIIFNRLPKLATFKKQVMFYAKTVKEQQVQFWAKNKNLHRPLSPHLTIYRLPLPAIMSITHRATGAALSGLTILFGLGSFYFAGNFDKLIDNIQSTIHPHVLLTLKALIAMTFVFKTLTGVRHLYWDSAKGLNLPLVYKSGYLAIAFTIIGGLALAIINNV